MVSLQDIMDGVGFCVESLTTAELEYVRGLITAQYLDRLGQLQPAIVEVARERGVANYHTLPIAFDHGKCWPKPARLLDVRYVKSFSEMGFFRRICQQIGPNAVISHDELNWRLVRPNQPSDTGPVPADKWFRDALWATVPLPDGSTVSRCGWRFIQNRVRMVSV